ncbi:MAG: hypothetical protein IPJ75_16680 [Ignavibacteriales bacterium]|nr:hypothetical protein [Ignavibacteriales bacterium]
MKFMSKFLLMSLMLFTFISAQSVEITVNGKTKKIKTIKLEKITFLSLSDLATKFSLKLNKSKENVKFDLTATSKSVAKFTAKNPNVIVTKDKKNKTYKMTKSAVKKGSDLYIPVAGSKDALSAAFEDKYSYKFPKDESIGKDTDKKEEKDTSSTVKKEDPTKDEDDDTDVKSTKKTVVKKATYEVKSNGLLARFTYTGEANGIKHSIKENGNKYISITIANSDITLKNIEKTFKSGPVKEVKGRVRKGTGELMIHLTNDYSSYEVKRIKSKKEIQVLVYSKTETSDTPVKKKMTGNSM